MRTDSLKLTKRPVNGAGFTLIEVMVAMAIFLFGALAIARLAHHSSTGNASARKLAEATRVGQRVLEELDLMVNFYYNEDEGVCNGKPFLLDPEPLRSGPDDSYCPNRVDDPLKPADNPSDLNETKVKLAALIDSNDPLSYSFTLQEIADDWADHCYPGKIGDNCPMVNAEGSYRDIGGQLLKKRMYYVVWNLRASYPGTMMTTVRLYIMWEDKAMGGKRHYVILNSIITAKDDYWYK